MKNLIQAAIPIILMLFNKLPLKNRFHYYMKKVILYGIAAIFLLSAYVFGCIALYYFLVPFWGEALSAFSLCLLSLLIGCGLILINKLLKSKKKQFYSQTNPLRENSLGDLPNAKDIIATLGMASPTILITVLGVAAFTTYMMMSGKKDK